MIKKILLLLFFSALCSSAFSQIEYYDAVALRKLTVPGTTNLNDQKDSVYMILDQYVPGDSSSKLAIRAAFNRQSIQRPDPNPFIELSGGAQSSSPYQPKQGFSLASIGGLNVTNFADGLAQFMVERFKEELNVAFFDQFKKDLNKPEFSDLRILFPQTNRLLNAIDQNIYQYNIYINTMREAFKNDLSNMYANADEVVNQPKYQYYLSLHPELKMIIVNSTYLINQYAKGTHPGEVLANYNADSRLTFTDKNVELNSRSAIKTLQLFSSSLRSKSGESYWISSDSAELLEDAVTFKIYLGLIYQDPKVAEIRFGSGTNTVSLKQVLDTVAKAGDSLARYKTYVLTFISQAREVDEYLAELKDKKKPEIDYNDYYKLFNSSLDLFEHAYTFIDLPYVNKVIPDSTRDRIRVDSERGLYVARAAGDLFIDVRTQNYSSAMINMISIMDTVLDYKKTDYLNTLETELGKLSSSFLGKVKTNALTKDQAKSLISLIESYSTNYTTKNVSAFPKEKPVQAVSDTIIKDAVRIIRLRRAVSTAKISNKSRAALLKYGSFMAAVVNARSSDDVKAAIESVVLPAGSYTVKRETNFNVSINSFIGPYGGAEYLPALKQHQWASTTGFTAPVGIAFSWGNYFNGVRSDKDKPVKPGAKKKGGQSFGFFIPVIDIGSVASFRLANDSSKVSSEIQLKNIISPGLYFYWGLPKCPVSLGIGGQIGPQLRQITAVSTNIDQNYYLRFGFNVVVDIPLFNIYSRN